ncbi:TB2/DP1, HVA22 family-domain-containing protein [Leucosporidium creatinivorum]|uniref:Protein YOP1 n=1 Tax=Leucosporidium creatinivorum TaxID=106004 RepID=A0A1Y2EGU4_9BASI|nr:TB2/DP1, HVA22 family-domain-containing protein [Leucosporidium creatinivorum]
MDYRTPNPQQDFKAMASAQAKFEYYIAQVDKELSKYPALNRLEQQINVPKAYGVLAVGTFFSSFIFFNIFAGFLSNLLGWALPAYLSLKALDTPGHDDDTQWLTYWIIFGAFNFLESMSKVLVAWFPYYYTFKTIFILYLILPSTRGAQVIFVKAFKPLMSSSRTQAATTTTPVAAPQ